MKLALLLIAAAGSLASQEVSPFKAPPAISIVCKPGEIAYDAPSNRLTWCYATNNYIPVVASTGGTTSGSVPTWADASGGLLVPGLPVATTSAANSLVETNGAGKIDASFITGISGGTVTTTGTPTTGSIAIFSGLTSIATGNLSGDATTSGSAVVTVSKINGTAFSGTSGHAVTFGASNTPADGGAIVQTSAANSIVKTNGSGTIDSSFLPAFSGFGTVCNATVATTTFGQTTVASGCTLGGSLILVFLNGSIMQSGSGNDYTVSGNNIILDTTNHANMPIGSSVRIVQ